MNTWGTFRNYQKFAHHAITLSKYRENEQSNFYKVMQAELQDMIDDIIMSSEDIQDLKVNTAACNDDVVAMTLTAGPTASEKTQVMLLKMYPTWIGVDIDGFPREYHRVMQQLKKWLMTVIPVVEQEE